MASHTATRSLGGVDGYRRLARLVVRTFYSDEVPPREEEDKEAQALAPRSKLPKHTFEGLGILLIDYLASPKVDGYADEVQIAAELRLSQKNIRKALRYLEGERIVAAETVKFSLRRRNAEATDDPEVEERKRQETHVFWCLDYPRLVDALRLRLHKVRETLRRQVEDADAVLQYRCPQCGATFSSLHAASLLDPMAGIFRCEDCRGELVEHIEGPGGAAAGPGGAASRRERQAFFKSLQGRFDTQLKPVLEQLERLRDVPPPDFGSLQDWYQNHKENLRRRALRLEAARRQMQAGGMAAAEMTEEQLLEWAEKAEVVVALPGMPGAGEDGGAGLAPAKELPVWFRGEGPSGSVVSQEEGMQDERAAVAAAAAHSEVERKRLEQQYLEQYLRQLHAQNGAGPAGGAAGIVSEAKDGLKTELNGDIGGGGGGIKDEEMKEEEVGKEDDIEWEDAGEAMDVAEKPAADGEDEDDWVDV